MAVTTVVRVGYRFSYYAHKAGGFFRRKLAIRLPTAVIVEVATTEIFKDGMLSGYPSELYDRELSKWNRHEILAPNNAAGGKTKRKMTEVVWINY